LLANVLYQRSMVYEKLNQPGKAIADLRRVVELYPDNPHGWNALGYTFENLVNMYSLVLADTQWCAINEAYDRTFAQQNLLDK